MEQLLDPRVRIAQRWDRLEKRVARAAEAARAGLMVEVLEHEQCVDIHLAEITRLSAKYEVPQDITNSLRFILREHAQVIPPVE